jgi:Tol biopolymer transport system component
MCSVLCAEAQNTTTRVSVATGGGQGTGGSLGSRFPDVSADGRYVVFQSSATDLVAGDTNGVDDVFLHDRQTGATERISVGPAGVQGNAQSAQPDVSDDGRFVVFASNASNLVANDTNGAADIFVRDRQTGTTSRVSVATGGVQAVGASALGKISGNGRMVAIYSLATNLVAGDTNGLPDIFRHDRETGETVRVSVATGGGQAGGGGSFVPAINADGRFITFHSASPNLVAGDTNGTSDVFIRDVDTGMTSRVSVTSAGVQGSGLSANADVSADGRYVVFQSSAGNLDAMGRVGIFVHDRQTGVTAPVGVEPSPAVLPAEWPRISRDGRFIVYEDDISNADQVFIVDRQTLVTSRLDVSTNGTPGDGWSNNAAINGDGTVTTFNSGSTNLVAGDTNAANDIFVRHIPGNAGGTPTATMALDNTSLRFGAVKNGTTLLSQTAAQIVRMTQTGAGTVTWTATSNATWLQVSPASGTGSADLSISVSATGTPVSGSISGAITIALTNAANSVGPINVTLTLMANGTSANPVVNLDTPTDNRTGVTGAVPFTGWAVDDIEMLSVAVCRAAFGSEVAPVDPNCGGQAQIFIGFGVFIEGARPDVAAAYPTYPASSKAGWGLMVLTNMLPAQGNGTYVFSMWAKDRDGHTVLMGTRTMTCANASATLPFGAIDTPAQGGVASGAAYTNFGWALTPLPKTIPTDGSTIQVVVDGAVVGSPTYNQFRSDIATLFPGLNNTNGAVGFRGLDTTALTNGTHTIAWVVTDNQGAADGIGSRFFTVSNGASALTAAPAAAETPIDRPLRRASPAPIAGRRGWNLSAPLLSFTPDASGRVVVRSEEVSRVELQLEPGTRGYLRTHTGPAPLPIGSQINDETGVFTWAPGVGYVGAYDLEFVARDQTARSVRVVLQPKGAGAVGPQVVIDTPRMQQDVAQPFRLGGWAADLDARQGTGIATLHAWAYPLAGGPPVFLGATMYGGRRADVAAVHGDQFEPSGFDLTVQGLAPGNYDVAVFAWSVEAMGFAPAKIVRITIR